jgi:hypothetical protein
MAPPYPLAVDRRGIRYTLLEPPSPFRARFTFSGTFESAEVLWDATLFALGDPDPTDANDVRRDYLEIGGPTGLGRQLTVALGVPAIDDATILRTIIMIRQYRRLRPGRIGFGRP